MNTIEQAREVSKLLRVKPYTAFDESAADTIDALLAELADERIRGLQLLADAKEWQQMLMKERAELAALSLDLHTETAAVIALRAELDTIKSQEPVASMTRCTIEGARICKCGEGECNDLVDVFLAAGAQTNQLLENPDELSVGDSSFESWYASYVKEGTKGLKHHCRDAYAAGMGDPLVTYAQPVQQEPVMQHCPNCNHEQMALSVDCGNCGNVYDASPVQAQERKPVQQESCRIELVTAIHTLASHYENTLCLFRDDEEAHRVAKGDITHARKVAEKWNWNGTAQEQRKPVQQEPVASMTRCTIEGTRICKCGEGECNDLVDVFLAAGAQPAPCKPLSEKQIHKLWKNLGSDEGIEEFARAIEQAHLIGEQP